MSLTLAHHSYKIQHYLKLQCGVWPSLQGMHSIKVRVDPKLPGDSGEVPISE